MANEATIAALTAIGFTAEEGTGATVMEIDAVRVVVHFAGATTTITLVGPANKPGKAAFTATLVP